MFAQNVKLVRREMHFKNVTLDFPLHIVMYVKTANILFHFLLFRGMRRQQLSYFLLRCSILRSYQLNIITLFISFYISRKFDISIFINVWLCFYDLHGVSHISFAGNFGMNFDLIFFSF